MRRFVWIFLTALLVFSCSNDDDGQGSTPLEGRWTLTNVVCFCYFGENPDFSVHKLIFEGNELKVENTGGFNFFESAVGNFSLQGNTITLNNGQQYTYNIEGDVLELTFVDDPGIADDEIFFSYISGN